MNHAPTWLVPRTAYVHIPFCGHQCGYCDFAVTAGQDHLIELYLEALEQEIRRLDRSQSIETLFIGGGTPTYLNNHQLARLLSILRDWLPFDSWDNREFSIESTPESLDRRKIQLLSDYGVNRLSIGIQTFHPHLLSALDRRHGVEQISEALEIARTKIPAVSLDLIFAAPNQEFDEWKRDLDTACTYQPQHLSTYGLTYEKGTPLWKQRERGLIRNLPEQDELAMYEYAMDRLTELGFEHYEISNFAKPGYRCRHNERYWANDAYFGFGVGAARYLNGKRELNVRDTKLYIQRVLAGESPTFQSEELAPRERAFETIAVQLRRREGIHRGEFLERTGFELDELLGDAQAMFVENGLLIDDRKSIRLSRRGCCVADGIIEHFMKSQ